MIASPPPAPGQVRPALGSVEGRIQRQNREIAPAHARLHGGDHTLGHGATVERSRPSARASPQCDAAQSVARLNERFQRRLKSASAFACTPFATTIASPIFRFASRS